MSHITLQYMIAEYLQISGEKSSANLAARFTRDHQSIRVTLRQMQRHGYIKSDGGRPQIWAYANLPPKNGTIKIPHKRRARQPQPQAIFAGFGRPDLSALAAMPVVRL